MNGREEVNLIRAIGSAKRANIIDLMAQEKRPFRFMELSRSLEILPSTLEAHLQVLVEQGIIAHRDGFYTATLATIKASQILEEFHKLHVNNYLKTHRLILDNDNLINEFAHLSYRVLPNLISIMSVLDQVFKQEHTLVQIGGGIDPELEFSWLSVSYPRFQSSQVEILLSKKSFSAFSKTTRSDMLIDLFNWKRTWFYLVNQLHLCLGIYNNVGILFLPDLDLEVDFKQCLYFDDEQGIDWLQRLFNYLKQNSQEISSDLMKSILPSSPI